MLNEFGSVSCRGDCLGARQILGPLFRNRFKNWLMLILPMVVAGCAALQMGQDASWDVRNYHFYSGFALLHKPLHFDFAPAQIQSFLNPVLHVLSYVLLAHLPSKMAALALASVQSINFWLLFRIAEYLFRDWQNPLRFVLGISCAAAGCYGPIFITELGTTFGDSLTSPLILAGLVLIVKYTQSEMDFKNKNCLLAAAGAFLGLAVGIKLTLVCYAVAAVVALFVLMACTNMPMRPLVWLIGFSIVGFVVFYGYWGWALYHEYKNPVFPYLNALFRSPWYDLQNVADERFMPRTWLQTFFYPFFFAVKNRLVGEIEFRDARIALCYIALAVLLFKGMIACLKRVFDKGSSTSSISQFKSVLFLATFFIISYGLWQLQFSVYRYLIVLELLAPLLLVLVLSCLVQSRSKIFYISLLLNAGICAWLIPPDFGRQVFDDQYLKVSIPEIQGLEQSVVLMGGEGPTSYIIPSFPSSTCFVRIRSNFFYPGRNQKLDEKVRGILKKYDANHTYVFIAGQFEKESVLHDAAFYGISTDERSCRQLQAGVREAGWLCRAALNADRPKQAKNSLAIENIKFVEISGVSLKVNPDMPMNGDWIRFRLTGIKMHTIDVLYSLNGVLQPPQRIWHLDKDQSIQFPVTAVTPRGLYHFIGIRASTAGDMAPWIKVNSRVRIP